MQPSLKLLPEQCIRAVTSYILWLHGQYLYVFCCYVMQQLSTCHARLVSKTWQACEITLQQPPLRPRLLYKNHRKSHIIAQNTKLTEYLKFICNDVKFLYLAWYLNNANDKSRHYDSWEKAVQTPRNVQWLRCVCCDHVLTKRRFLLNALKEPQILYKLHINTLHELYNHAVAM